MQTKHVLTFNFPKTRLQIEYATTFWRKFQASTFTIKSFSNSRRAQDVNPGFLLPRNTGEEKDLAHMSESLARLAHMSESLAQLAHMSESLAQLAHMSESLAQLAHTPAIFSRPPRTVSLYSLDPSLHLLGISFL